LLTVFLDLLFSWHQGYLVNASDESRDMAKQEEDLIAFGLAKDGVQGGEVTSY
jgi:hypothetical protein